MSFDDEIRRLDREAARAEAEAAERLRSYELANAARVKEGQMLALEFIAAARKLGRDADVKLETVVVEERGVFEKRWTGRGGSTRWATHHEVSRAFYGYCWVVNGCRIAPSGIPLVETEKASEAKSKFFSSEFRRNVERSWEECGTVLDYPVTWSDGDGLSEYVHGIDVEMARCLRNLRDGTSTHQN